MRLLKYLAIDFLGLIALLVIVGLLSSYGLFLITTYAALFFVCATVSILFAKGKFHGLSIGVEVCVIVFLGLYLIGAPVSMPISAVLNKETIISVLPLPLIGSIAGFIGETLKSKRTSKDFR